MKDFSRIMRNDVLTSTTPWQLLMVWVILANYETGEYLCQVTSQRTYFDTSPKVELRVLSYDELESIHPHG